MSSPDFPDTGRDSALCLAGPAGALEAMLEFPASVVAAQPVIAVVCHPLPTEGGSMDNKVVTMAARALRELGVTTLRFNFRGTGASEGSFDDGAGELEDLSAVAAWVRATRPEAQLWLAGFSFGAYVSLRMADELQPKLLISIAPPAGRWDFDRIAPPAGYPWIVIQGEADEIVDPNAVYAWLDGLRQPPELVRMPDTSHFFHRRLIDLRGAIKHSVRAHLPPETAPGAAAGPA